MLQDAVLGDAEGVVGYIPFADHRIGEGFQHAELAVYAPIAGTAFPAIKEGALRLLDVRPRAEDGALGALGSGDDITGVTYLQHPAAAIGLVAEAVIIRVSSEEVDRECRAINIGQAEAGAGGIVFESMREINRPWVLVREQQHVVG